MTLKPPLLELDPDAFAIWRDSHDHIEKTLARDGDYGELTDLGAKIAEQAARVACVLHVFEQGPVGPIPADTMQAGADIALWHLQEARRVFGLAETDQATHDAELMLDWLSAQPAPPSLKQLAQYAPYRLRNKKRRDQALDKLEAHSLVRRECDTGSTLVRINPKWQIAA